MPKMKTHRGAAKRFKVTKSGKLVYNHAFKSHILEKKKADRKRKLRKADVLSAPDTKRVKQLIPYK